MKKIHANLYFLDLESIYIQKRKKITEFKTNRIMLVDRITKQTYSCNCDAVRKLGRKEFNNKVKRNEMDYIQCVIIN